MTSGKLLTTCTFLDLADRFASQIERQKEEDRIQAHGVSSVATVFPHNEAGAGVMMDLADAYSAMEACRQEDSGPSSQAIPSKSMTKSILSNGNPLGLPSRRGGFSLDVSDRTYDNGEPMYRFDQSRGKWVPNE